MFLHRLFKKGGKSESKAIEASQEPVPETPEEETPLYELYVDSPRVRHINSGTLHVEGWVIFQKKPESEPKLRVVNGNSIHDIPYGKSRPDVADRYPQFAYDGFEKCGFESDISYEDGYFSLQLDIGEGYQEIYALQVSYSPELLVDMMTHPNLAQYSAEHQNIIENKKKLYYEDNYKEQFVLDKNDPKLVAFYLPQFHPIAENDTSWGKGFTEWTNVTQAVPRFVGHYQPILPKNGFYDLRVEQNIKDQIDLAKQHGIYGFCFYYYWFSGKKILDTPLNSLLAHKEWNFNFTICWANENWTKRWDGRDDDVILSQKYDDRDAQLFIEDVANILNDERYITHEGKPVLVVYRASDLKNPKRYADTWRTYFQKMYSKELYIVSCMGFETDDPRQYGFDSGLDFAPQTSFFKGSTFGGGEYPYINQKMKYLDPRFNGAVMKYGEVALNQKMDSYFDFPVIPSIAPSWDNDARRKGTGFVMFGANPDMYGEWLERTIHTTVAPYIFVNAWNEWAEGAILEPTAMYGYAYLNRTTEVIAAHSDIRSNRENFPKYSLSLPRNVMSESAAIIYIDDGVSCQGIPSLISRLKKLKIDIYITATQKVWERLREIDERIGEKVVVVIVPNRGRDAWPFLFVANRLKDEYEYFIKLRLNGSVEDLLPRNLTEKKTLLRYLKRVGGYVIQDDGERESLAVREYEKIISTFTTRSVVGAELTSIQDLMIPGLDSFWTRKDNLNLIFKIGLTIEDFEPEMDQNESELTTHKMKQIMAASTLLSKMNIEDIHNVLHSRRNGVEDKGEQ